MNSFISLRIGLLVAVSVGFLASAAQAQEEADSREASFLPPPASLLSVTPSPMPEEAKETKDLTVPPPFSPDKAQKKEAIKPERPAKPPVKEEIKKEEPKKEETKKEEIKKEEKKISVPVVPPSPPKAQEDKGDALSAVKPVVVMAPEAPAPLPPVPLPVPSNAEVVAPAPAAVAPAPVSRSVVAEPVVASAPLSEVDPEAKGLLAGQEGGLGALLWKDTHRSTVDRLMPMINLPTFSPALNDLAKRIFMSSASAPIPSSDGEKPIRSLLAQRIEGLVALGAVPEAWQLASLTDAQSIDSITLRRLAEAALIGANGDDVCQKIPALMEVHGKTEEGKAEWQKAFLICQLRANDEKGVQLGLDMMRENQVKDDVFLTLMNSNLLGGKKILPRQLTPLRPANLAILHRLDLPLPSEIYARPEAALIPELLLSKAVDDKARLDLAERVAARGIITAAQLKGAYQRVTLSAEEVAATNTSVEKGARPRAILYQAMLAEGSPAKKIALMQKYLTDLPPAVLCGAQGALLADILQTVPVTSESNVFAADAARILALASRPDQAAVWLKLAREAATRAPNALAGLIRSWPVFALAGLVPDGDYATGMKIWLDAALSGADKEFARTRTEQALLVLSAAGYAVPEEAWQRVMEVTAPTKQMMPAPALMDRLRQAAAAGRKGETALISLLLMGGGAGEASFGVKTDVIRALRLTGLVAEAQALARETLVGLE